MNLTEKVAFIKGLAEGMNIDEKSNEGKIINAIIDLLDDMAVTVSDLDDDYGDLSNQVDEIDEDLFKLEEEVFGGEDDCCCCDEEEPVYEVVCPTCQEVICLDEDLLLDVH